MTKSSATTNKAQPERLAAQPISDGEGLVRVERRDVLLRFLAEPPRHVVEAAQALREAGEQYGGDIDLELADLEAGQHPLQLAKADAPRQVGPL